MSNPPSNSTGGGPGEGFGDPFRVLSSDPDHPSVAHHLRQVRCRTRRVDDDGGPFSSSGVWCGDPRFSAHEV